MPDNCTSWEIKGLAGELLLFLGDPSVEPAAGLLQVLDTVLGVPPADVRDYVSGCRVDAGVGEGRET
jgi:hypothetical protein